MEENRTLNFVYEWIGPTGAITNNRIPTVIDLALSLAETEFRNIDKHDLIQTPHFCNRFYNYNLIPSCKIPDGKFLYELNFHNYHYRDIERAFHYSDGLLANNNIHHNVIERVRMGDGFFLLTLLFEGFVHARFLHLMTEYFRRHRIPLSQIVYVTNSFNGNEMYARFCKDSGNTPEIQVEYFPVFRIDKSDVNEILNEKIDYVPGKRNRLFLCFNRRYSEHRVLLFLAMDKLNLVDKSYISMDAKRPEGNENFIEFSQGAIRNFPALSFQENDIERSSRKLPLILDSNNFSSYPMENHFSSVKRFFDDSYINLVTETYFFNDIIHITEKTYKPIAYKQPFILIAAPNSLKHVKEMGFKTFDLWWDESYDQICDHVERFKKIVDIIQMISQWNEEQLIQFTVEAKDILEYNANHLNTMENKEIIDFTNKYGNIT